jgi:hypothetical protein
MEHAGQTTGLRSRLSQDIHYQYRTSNTVLCVGVNLPSPPLEVLCETDNDIPECCRLTFTILARSPNSFARHGTSLSASLCLLDALSGKSQSPCADSKSPAAKRLVHKHLHRDTNREHCE